MANGHGGARPGAGRKRKSTEQYQADMRALTRECVTEEDWKTVVSHALARAKSGDAVSRSWLAAYITGAPEQKVTHTSDPDAPVRVLVEYSKREDRKDNPT